MYVQKASGNTAEVLRILLVLVGPPSLLLQHFSSFPRHLGVWRKVRDDAGTEDWGPAWEGLLMHTHEFGMCSGGKCRAIEGF